MTNGVFACNLEVMKKKINVESLVDQIEKITREKIAKESVVSLEEYRKLKRKSNDMYSVLVIEDDPTMRAALVRLMEDEGYLVASAADGTQLEKVFDKNSFDLILLDVGLPWVNGFELTEVIKSHEDLKHIPIILISGMGNEEDFQKGLALGAESYIKKPFDIDALKNMVSHLIKK